jgi:hypothetical protein
MDGSSASRARAKTHLDQVCVPSIAADVDVVVAEFLSRRLAKDVSWRAASACGCLAQRNLCEFAPRFTARTVLGSPHKTASHDGRRRRGRSSR